LGIPFREAHHVAGRIVAVAESRSSALENLDLAEMRKIHPGITAEVFKVLSVENSVASRTSFAGTAPDNVRREAEAWLKRLDGRA
jgi:argininosuccinate lyase